METNEFGESQMVPYDFPLRPGVRARLRLPADLTEEEAERLCGVIKALAFPSGVPREVREEEGALPTVARSRLPFPRPVRPGGHAKDR